MVITKYELLESETQYFCGPIHYTFNNLFQFMSDKL
jgi:hypothetical protein